MTAKEARDRDAGDGAGLQHVAARLAALLESEGTSSAEPLGPDHPAFRSPPLQALIRAFDLAPFEAFVLLLAFGVEVSPEIQALCGRCLRDDDDGYASFRLAIALCPGADWRSLSPIGPLRRWSLITLEEGGAVLDTPLRISEFALHWLCEVKSRDGVMLEALDPVSSDRSERLAPSQAAFAARIATLARSDEGPAASRLPIVICADERDADALASSIASSLGFGADRLRLDMVAQSDRPSLDRALRRERALVPGLLTVALEPQEAEDKIAGHMAFVRRLPGPVLITTQDRPNHNWGPAEPFPNPTREEQRSMWRERLGEAADGLEPMLGRFDLGRGGIDAAYSAAKLAKSEMGRSGTWRRALSQACRQQLRGPLDAFADRIKGQVELDDLVLPPIQRALLEAIIRDVGNQPSVLDAWRAGGGSSRGLGLTALFSGPSGSGKTTAAEALAGALDLDLYRVDLAAVVSKYIGETEKQLAKVFDAAERGANLLLFDEGDALFGKRTEVRDSHDRYANQEVSFLLQKLESYRGLAVLASNLADSMDAAFMRRFRYVIEFPQPGLAQREAIWRRVFGRGVVTEGLDFARLARMNLSGGAIRNVALNAAFLAAAEQTPVTMRAIYQAAEEEYRKLHKVMTDDERGGEGFGTFG